MKILYIYILLFIKLSYSVIYIDLKNKYISPGVIVHHGYFTSAYQYKMFVGQNSSIDLVRYGDDIIFQRNDPDGYVSAIVELYESPDIIFTIIYVTAYDRFNREVVSVFRYETIDDKMVYVKYTHKNINNTKVRISLDISENANIHPFIEKTENNGQEVREVKFKIVEHYKGIFFDGTTFPKYGIGDVFDPERRVLVGYGIYESLIDKCEEVTIITSGGKTNVKLNGFRGELVYEQVQVNLMNFWSYIGNTSLLAGTGKRMGIVGKNKIEKTLRIGGKKTLDIAEMAAPELSNILKAKGVLGNYDYKIFHPMPGSEPIEAIIETTTKYMKILYAKEKGKILSLEVIDDKIQMNVLVYYENYIEGKIIRKVGIYKRRYNETGYNLTDEKQTIEKIQHFRDKYPVYLSINMEDNSKVIYDSELVGDKQFEFKYFYINEYESYDNTKSKYRFGAISEINPYDVGNIPSDHFNRGVRVIRENLNCTEFLVRNPLKHKPVDVSSYEVYVLMS